MKWYHWILIVLSNLILFGGGYLFGRYWAPLACPLCLCDPCKGRDVGYWDGWLKIINHFAMPAGLGILAAAVVVVGLATWAAVSLHKIARG